MVIEFFDVCVEMMLGYLVGIPQAARAKKNSTFEVLRDKEGKFRFRLKAANGEIIATSEGYEAKRECFRGIESVRVNVAKATTKDITRTS